MHCAIIGGNLDIVTLLVDNGADFKSVNDDELTPLEMAIVEKNKKDIFFYLLGKVGIFDISADHAEHIDPEILEEYFETSSCIRYNKDKQSLELNFDIFLEEEKESVACSNDIEMGNLIGQGNEQGRNRMTGRSFLQVFFYLINT